MSKTFVQTGAMLAACGTLASCASLPSTGPSASAVARQAVRLETVSPQDAATRWAEQAASEQRRVAATLGALTLDRSATPIQLFPGARVNVTLWTEPMAGNLTSDTAQKTEAATKTDLGAFTVDDAGAVALPYIGSVAVANRDLNQARQVLTQRFAATRKFQAPQVTLTILANAHQQIIVTGSANRPTMVDWRPGGVSLGEAITLAGGNLSYEQGQGQGQGQGHVLTANHVIIIRKGTKFELPLKAALESNIQLRPNDQVLIEHQAAVNIQCLGGGWPQNTVQAFDETPSLSRVVATGGGLSTQQAQGASVFVLSADRQVIREFKWNTLSGLQAAQAFPLQDGDIVYIATAPIIRIQQVTNILFSAAYPVNLVRNAN